MAEPIIICGQQRSGTTALQSALSRVDGVRNFGEIFQFHKPLIEGAPHNFYYYVNNVRGGWVAITSFAQAEEELKRYFDYLGQLADGSYFVADIKYNLWHHFAPGWLNSMGRPFMMEYFKKKQVPLIHVVRRDTFRQFVSQEFAGRAQKWHYTSGSESAPEISHFDLNCGELAEHFEMVDGNVALFRKRLSGYSRAEELVYEELFDGTQLRPGAKAKLRRILPGWVVDRAESHFVKPAVDQMAKIGNAGSVIDYFRHTKYGVMVMDALRPPLPPAPRAAPPVDRQEARLEQSDAVIANGSEEHTPDSVEQATQDENRHSPANGTGN